MLGYTALHYAAELGKEENVKWLVEAGTPWNQINNEHQNAGQLALREGRHRCYQIIFEGGVKQGERTPFRHFTALENLTVSEYEWWYKEKKSPVNTYYLSGDIKNQAFNMANESYLSRPVVYAKPRPHDEDHIAMLSPDGTGVMMEWERPLSECFCDAICS